MQNKVELIKSHCHSQDFDKAEVEAKKLTKEYPKFSELYNLYGNLINFYIFCWQVRLIFIVYICICFF